MNGSMYGYNRRMVKDEKLALSISIEDMFKCEKLPFASLLNKYLKCENLAPACTSTLHKRVLNSCFILSM